MTKITLLAAAALLASTGASFLAKAQSLDSSLGQHVAEKSCSECHQIDARSFPEKPQMNAPSFVAIARMPSTNELAIKVFLRSSHRHMPDIILSREEINSVAAYIMGLAKK